MHFICQIKSDQIPRIITCLPFVFLHQLTSSHSCEQLHSWEWLRAQLIAAINNSSSNLCLESRQKCVIYGRLTAMLRFVSTDVHSVVKKHKNKKGESFLLLTLYCWHWRKLMCRESWYVEVWHLPKCCLSKGQINWRNQIHHTDSHVTVTEIKQRKSTNCSAL